MRCVYIPHKCISTELATYSSCVDRVRRYVSIETFRHFDVRTMIAPKKECKIASSSPTVPSSEITEVAEAEAQKEKSGRSLFS